MACCIASGYIICAICGTRHTCENFRGCQEKNEHKQPKHSHDAVRSANYNIALSLLLYFNRSAHDALFSRLLFLTRSTLRSNNDAFIRKDLNKYKSKCSCSLKTRKINRKLLFSSLRWARSCVLFSLIENLLSLVGPWDSLNFSKFRYRVRDYFRIESMCVTV